MNLFSLAFRNWFSNLRGDTLSGIVVALALIPEAIGFSVIAGVDPKVGLYGSVVIACVIAFTGGRVAMISAATASTAVLMTGIVHDHGVQYLFAATILMGVIQIVAGLLKLGRLMRFVSQSVMTGFVNALAILILLAQLPELVNVPIATYGLIALGLAIIYLFPRLTRAIPLAPRRDCGAYDPHRGVQASGADGGRPWRAAVGATDLRFAGRALHSGNLAHSPARRDDTRRGRIA